MAFKSELSQFLHNTLSGATEDPSIASTALVLPIGKRTNLSRAKDQINKAFDKVEASLNDLIKDETPKAFTFVPNYNIVSERPAMITKKKREASGGNIVGTLIGGILGLTGEFLATAFREASKLITNIVKSVKDWLSTAKQTLKDWFKTGYGCIKPVR